MTGSQHSYRANGAPRSGLFVFVVGASGAGKDSVMTYARDRLALDRRIRFVQRVIDRAPAAGEVHTPVTKLEFDEMVANGKFALHWQAHGHSYGLPVELDDWLLQGDVVIANGSRAILPSARSRYPSMLAINITVRPDVLATRLAARGRESAEAIERRLLRSQEMAFDDSDMMAVDNSGPLEMAGECFLKAIGNR